MSAPETMANKSVPFQRGQMIEMDGLLGVVVGTGIDDHVPADHVDVWFGEPRATRKSQGGVGGLRPEIWTMPVGLCTTAAEPVIRH